MTPYQNQSRKSGVVAYEIGSRFIKVRFKGSRTVYVYDYDTPGSRYVREMKRLAAAGRGLSTYIAQHVKNLYARRE